MFTIREIANVAIFIAISVRIAITRLICFYTYLGGAVENALYIYIDMYNYNGTLDDLI